MTTTPVALVTGTSSGIGLETAVGLARAGLHVVATMRDPDRSGPLRVAAAEHGVELEVTALDVTDRAAAARCVQDVEGRHGGIDVLVNNAGRGSVATLEQLDDAALQAQLDVNYLGPVALTRLVLPGMRAAGRGRVVTVTSVGGAVGQPFADAYCGAKFAVEGLMQSLAPVAARFGVDICVVEPGAVASEFVANIGIRDRTPDLADPYAPALAGYLRRSAAAFASAQSARDAAAVVVEAATTTAPRFRWQTSPAAAGFVGLSLADLDGSGVLGQTTGWLDG
jgi:NAD(P)-dependent dehydrogenase (short-subunit alcohol dehydrogenase family)